MYSSSQYQLYVVLYGYLLVLRKMFDSDIGLRHVRNVQKCSSQF